MAFNIFAIFLFNYLFVFQVLRIIAQSISNRRRSKLCYCLLSFTFISLAFYLYFYQYRSPNLYEYFSLRRRFTSEELGANFKEILSNYRGRSRMSEEEVFLTKNLQNFYDILSNSQRRSAYDKYGETNDKVVYARYYDYFRVSIELLIYFKFVLLAYFMTAQENVRNSRKYLLSFILSFYLMEVHYYMGSPKIIQNNFDIIDMYLPNRSIFERVDLARVLLIFLLNIVTFYHAIYIDNKEKTAADTVRRYIKKHYEIMEECEKSLHDSDTFERCHKTLDNLNDVKKSLDTIFRNKESYGVFDFNFTRVILYGISFYVTGWVYQEAYFTYFYRIEN